VIIVVPLKVGVLEECPRPRGQLEDKKSWPWPWPPWPQKGSALALALALKMLASNQTPVPLHYGEPGTHHYVINIVIITSTNRIACVQSPVRVAGRAVYVIDSERLALTSLPVMSPEVVRCVWDEHRRLRRRPRSPTALAARRCRLEPSTIGRPNTKDFGRATREECDLPPSAGELMAPNNYQRSCPQAMNGGLRSTANYEEITQTLAEATHIRRGRTCT